MPKKKSKPREKFVSVSIVKSSRDKKWKATFKDAQGKSKTIHFGAKGMEDYTTHKDKARKERYLKRMGADKSNQDWTRPDNPGSLSRWILWNKTSLNKSIADFKSRFKLK